MGALTTTHRLLVVAAATVAASVALAVGIMPALAAAQEAQPVCSAAKDLVGQSDPRRAVALIAAAQALVDARTAETEVCPEELAEAAGRVGDAGKLAAQATQELADGRWDAATALAEAALAMDRENPSAKLTKKMAESQQQGEASTPTTWKAHWDEFAEEQVQPTAGVLLPFLLTLLALTVLARVLVLLPRTWPDPGDMAPRLPLLSTASLATTGVLVVWGLPSTTTTVSAWAKYVVVGVAALCAIAVTAWWLATRLRLQLRVNDEKGDELPARTGHVVALLNELGAAPPRGLEVPRGADTTALDGAFAAVPDNGIWKTLKGLITSISGSTPWHATVECLSSDRLAVSVTRNGRSAGSTVVANRSISPLAGSEASQIIVDLDKAAAAYILTTIAAEYPGIQQSLGGSRDWRGLALHYIATTDLSEDDDEELSQRKVLLAHALSFDPGNLPAQLAFRHAFDRQESGFARLQAYGTWLDAFIVGLVGDTSASEEAKHLLRIRAAYTHAIVASNAIFAEGKPAPASDPRPDARNALKSLLDTLAEGSNDPREKALMEQVGVATEALKVLPGLPGHPAPNPDLATLKPSSPLGEYNWAAYFASRNEPAWVQEPAGNRAGNPATAASAARSRAAQDHDDLTAVGLLDHAVVLPRIANWVVRDPQLLGFRTRLAYRQRFLREPRQDFFEVAPVSVHAAHLRAAGYPTTSALADLKDSSNTLAGIISADEAQRRTIVRLAKLSESVPHSLGRWRVEILHFLGAKGMTSLSAVRGANARTLASETADHLLAECRPFAANQGQDRLELERLEMELPALMGTWLISLRE